MCPASLGHTVYHTDSGPLQVRLISGSSSLPDPPLPQQNKQRVRKQKQKLDRQPFLLTPICKSSLQNDMISRLNHLKPVFKPHVAPMTAPTDFPFPYTSGGGRACDSPGLGSSCAHHCFWMPERPAWLASQRLEVHSQHQLSLSRC